MYLLIASFIFSFAHGQVGQSCKTSFVGTPVDLEGVAKKIRFDEETKTTWVTGTFTKVGGVPRTNVVALDQRLNVLPVNPRMNGEVNDVIQVGNQILIAGDFNRVGDFKDVGSLLKLNSDGTIDKSFPKFKGTVEKLIPDGQGGVYVAGLVKALGDESQDYDWFRHFDKNGKRLSVSSSMSKLRSVKDMFIHKDRFYFLSSSNGLMIFDLRSERLLASFPQQDIFHAMKDIALYHDTLVVSGDFIKIGQTEVSSLALIGEDFKVTPLKVPQEDFVTDIEQILVVGDLIYFTRQANLFTYDLKTQGVSKTGLRATHLGLFEGKLYSLDMYQKNMEVNVLDPATNDMKKIPLPFSGGVDFMHVTEKGLTFSGRFLDADGDMHFNITLNSETGFKLDPNGKITSLAKDGADHWIGGEFSVIGGQTIKGLVSYDLSTSTYHKVLTNDFIAIGKGFVEAGDDVYATGYFADKIYYSNGLAKINVQKNEAIVSLTGSLESQAVSGDRLYLAGEFHMKDKDWCLFGYLNLPTSELTCQVAKKAYPAPTQYLENITLGKDKVYFQGEFTGLLDQNLKNILVFDPKTNLPAAWQADITALWRASSTIIEFDGVTYIGGVFQSVRGEDHSFFAAMDSTTGNFINWPLKMTASYAMGLRRDLLMMSVYKGAGLTSLIQTRTCNH